LFNTWGQRPVCHLYGSPEHSDLSCLHQILQLFAGASGLVTNVDKCVVTLIRCNEEMVAAVQQVFPCVVAPFPCKYLGIPLSLTQLKRSEEQPLVDSVAARIPTWKSGLLTHVGRVLLTKVTLSAIPVHLSIACYLSAWAVTTRLTRDNGCSSGRELSLSREASVRWHGLRFCRPTCLGGLGILDLRFFGFALWLRWEWLRRT
jgi:hypothetical protein